MSQNIQYGAHTDGRWRRLAETIREVRPHILLLQECNGWLDQDMVQVAAAERDLGLRVLVAPSTTGFHVAAGYDPAVFTWLGWETSYHHQFLHGYGALRLAVDGVPLPLVVTTAHLSPHSADTAAREAQVLIARAFRHGGLGVIGGDINHCPVGDPEPDWAQLQPHQRAARTLPPDPGGQIRADTIVGRRFAQAAMVDVAAHLAKLRNDPALRVPTAGLVRIDQFHLTPALAPALNDYQIVDPGQASDHHGIVMTLDSSQIDLTQARTHT